MCPPVPSDRLAQQPQVRQQSRSTQFDHVVTSSHDTNTCTLNPFKKWQFSWFHRETDRKVFGFFFRFFFWFKPTETDRNRPGFPVKTENRPSHLHFRFTTLHATDSIYQHGHINISTRSQSKSLEAPAVMTAYCTVPHPIFCFLAVTIRFQLNQSTRRRQYPQQPSGHVLSYRAYRAWYHCGRKYKERL